MSSSEVNRVGGSLTLRDRGIADGYGDAGT